MKGKRKSIRLGKRAAALKGAAPSAKHALPKKGNHGGTRQPFPQAKLKETGSSSGAFSFSFSKAAPSFPYFVVLVCCMIYAAQLGAGEPVFHFQKSAEQVLALSQCPAQSSLSSAYASGARALLYLPEGKRSQVSTTFEGTGALDALKIARLGSPALNITRMTANGVEVCAPCENGRKYALASPSEGRITLEVEAAPAALPASAGRSGPAFFNEETQTYIEAPLELSMGGGWRSEDNAAMLSSFYGIDAPFHIYQAGLIAAGLRQGVLPSLAYPSVSALPNSIMQIVFSIPPEYSYKLYEILLFFVPILLFYMYSRKLGKWQGASFLFASLIYLYLPSIGYPAGGGADLFLYGLTAHTLATYLSLAYFLFAYEFLVERKNVSAAPAVLFFFLAFAANPRILFALGVSSAILAVAVLASAKWKRLAVLGVACAAAVAWMAAGFFGAMNVSSYGTLAGVSITRPEDGLLAFLQAGHYVLPVLFASGAYAAYRGREFFALLCALCALMVLAAATSPGLNSLVPFLDGLRFLPSFFLPAFFVSGLGACALFSYLVELVEKIGGKLKMDRETFAVAVAFAILVPFSFLAASAMAATSAQYAAPGKSLEAAAEQEWFAAAYAKTGSAPVLMVAGSRTSQYPVYGKGIGSTIIAGFGSPESLYALMREYGARYLIVGNYLSVPPGGSGISEIYTQIKNERGFSEAISYGPGRLLEAGGITPGKSVPLPPVPQYNMALAAACSAVVLVCLAAAFRLKD